MLGWIKRAWNGISGIRNPASWLVDIFGGKRSDSGISINGESSLTLPPVWYAIKKISGHVCQMPLVVHRRLDRGAEKASAHPAYRLLKTRPNKYQTAAQFKETLMVHALLWGNGKAAIIRDSGKPVELILIDPRRSSTLYVDGEKWHAVVLDADERLAKHGGTDASEERQNIIAIPDRDVLHVPGLGIDGASGLEVFDIGRNAIGLGLAQEKAANKDFENGSRPGILLEAPKGAFLNEDKAREFLADFNTWHKGVDNTGRAGLLREGMKAHLIGGNAEAAQWVEQRKFQRQEIAMIFGIESITGDDDSVSYNSFEQKTLAYLSNCLMPWLVRIEQECDEKLLSSRQKLRDTHYFKFNLATLLRSDFRTTIETLGIAITHRIMSPNEARERIDMNPYDGGDDFANPAITPGSPDDGGGSDEASEPAPSPEDMNRAAITSHLRHMIGVESRHVLNAAGNKRNYIGWVDQFYDSKWQDTMIRTFENFGGSRSLAEAHCDESRHELIEVAGTVTADGLADAISELVEQWPERATSLAETILTQKDLTNV